jgi:hypothetical protein
VDRVRFFAEECDRMQGITVFADAHNGWGGVTEDLLHMVHDDITTAPVFLFALTPHLDVRVLPVPSATCGRLMRGRRTRGRTTRSTRACR